MKIMEMLGGGSDMANLPVQISQVINELGVLHLDLAQLVKQLTPTRETEQDLLLLPTKASLYALNGTRLIVSATVTALYGLKVGNDVRLPFYLTAYHPVVFDLGKGLPIARDQAVSIDLTNAGEGVAVGVILGIPSSKEPGY